MPDQPQSASESHWDDYWDDESVKAAILKERERCARIAEKYAIFNGPAGVFAQEIAAAIRNPSPLSQPEGSPVGAESRGEK